MQAYASSYSGHARVNRLLFLASKTVGTPTELEALRLAADQLRKVCAWLLPDHSQQSLRGHRAVDTVVDVSVCVLCCKRYPRWVATLLRICSKAAFYCIPGGQCAKARCARVCRARTRCSM